MRNRNPNNEPTTIASYALAIAKTLDDCGSDSKAILQDLDIPLEIRVDPFERLPRSKVTELFNRAVSETRDPYFGLRTAKRLTLTTFHALGFSLVASTTLMDFLERFSRYFKIASDNANMFLEQNGNLTHLIIQPTSDLVGNETQDAFTAFLVRFMNILYDGDFQAVEVELMRAMPPPGPQPYIEAFGCEVKFSMPTNKLIFNTEQLNEPLLGGSKELAEQNDQVVANFLAKLDKTDIVMQVKSMVIEHLSTGNVSKAFIADKLHMSPRTLQNKLARHNTSFKELVEDIRFNLAREYLNQPYLSVNEITYILGFSDTSTFTRAFKRWSGHSPSQFRESITSTR